MKLQDIIKNKPLIAIIIAIFLIFEGLLYIELVRQDIIILLACKNGYLYSFFILILHILAVVVNIVGGIGIIKLKEWSRKIVILLQFFGAAVCIIPVILPCILTRSSIRSFYGNNLETLHFVIIDLIKRGIIPLIIILYLSRPKIKARFKQVADV